MRAKILLLWTIIMSAFFLSNCRKGPEDPAISFRSRKARLEGEWLMKSGNAALTKAPYNNNYAFNGTKVELNTTESGGPATIYTGSYNLTLNIKKNGTFTFRENFVGDIFEGSGTWVFLHGTNHTKNKEEVKFTIDAVSKGSADDHVFNQVQTTFSYKLVELRNKDLKIEALDKSFTNTNGVKIGFSSRYTFAQL